MAAIATESIEKRLDQLVAQGVLTAYERTNPTGQKLAWNLTFPEGADTLEFDPTGRTTAEVKAFAAGALAARASRRTGPREGSRVSQVRDELANGGEVVSVVPVDKAKVERTSMFNAAYALGHKGNFGVSTERLEDGTVRLVGKLKDGGAA